MTNRPKVGIGVFIFNDDGKILMGKRRNAHGDSTWGLVGGHLEFGESIENCIKRETLEETGLHICAIEEIGFTNDIFLDDGKHYLSIFLKAQIESGTLELKDPDKFERWEWFDFNNLPQPLFLPIINLINKYSLNSLNNSRTLSMSM